MYKKQGANFKFAPLYILSLKVDSFEYISINTDFSSLTTYGDKLKWFRIKNDMTQAEVACAVSISRNQYQRYENNQQNYIPVNVLSDLAETFRTDVDTITDKYNLFLITDQGQNLKLLRKSNNLTQKQLAVKLDVPTSRVKKWEQNRNRIPKRVFIRLFSKS